MSTIDHDGQPSRMQAKGALPGRAQARQGLGSSDDALVLIAREALRESIRSRRWRIFFRFLFIGLFLMLLLLPLIGTLIKLDSFGSAGRHAAIVDVSGVISAGSPANADHIIDALEAAFANKRTAGVIVNINSPGGSPVQAGQVFDAMLRLRSEHPDTPLHAVIADVGASGGYYIAAGADRIYADKASAVGSIGVRMDSFGAVEALKKLGIERRLITAGENKALLDPFLEEVPQHRAHLERVVEDIHQQFIAAVKQGRGERLSDDDAVFSGLFWSGKEALALGLVDELTSDREVARDVLGVEHRVDFTLRQGPLERLMGEVRLQAGLWLQSALHPVLH